MFRRFDRFLTESKATSAKSRVKVTRWQGDDKYSWAVTFDGRVVNAHYDLTRDQAVRAAKAVVAKIDSEGIDSVHLGAVVD